MLKLKISLSQSSGLTFVLPDALHTVYLQLKSYEKLKANALRNFRPVPQMPSSLKGVKSKILKHMPAGTSRGSHVDALTDRIVKIGPTGNPIGVHVSIQLNPELI